MSGGGGNPLRVRVHYDFASTLCYVAHRVMERLAPDLRELELELVWSPLDLAAVLGQPRGATVPEPRLANARRVARELSVPVAVPTRFADSREAHAAALLAEAAGREATWRERVFTAVYEQGWSLDDATTLERCAADLELALPGPEMDRAREMARERTEAARAAQVTGVPTFMLGRWPFGGIQEDTTMRQILRRYAMRVRDGRIAAPAIGSP